MYSESSIEKFQTASSYGGEDYSTMYLCGVNQENEPQLPECSVHELQKSKFGLKTLRTRDRYNNCSDTRVPVFTRASQSRCKEELSSYFSTYIRVRYKSLDPEFESRRDIPIFYFLCGAFYLNIRFLPTKEFDIVIPIE